MTLGKRNIPPSPVADTTGLTNVPSKGFPPVLYSGGMEVKLMVQESPPANAGAPASTGPRSGSIQMYPSTKASSQAVLATTLETAMGLTDLSIRMN